jgi:thiol-disulfide isomerase/thioredoxin
MMGNMRRVLMVSVFLLVALPVTLAPQVAAPGVAAKRIAGLWDAVVIADQTEIPFRFEIAQNGAQVQGFFFEGDRKIGATSSSFENGRLRLDYDFLNTTLEATFDGGQLRGTYRTNGTNVPPIEIRGRRFVPVATSTANTPQIAGNWVMYRTAPDGSKLDVSWRLYLRQSGSAVSGAILRTSGDTGALTGRWNGNTLVMSHFAGDRPLLLEARLNADGTLAITLDRRFTYRAARTSEARAKGIPEPPDPSRFTSVTDPSAPFHFSGLALDGRRVSEADPRFRGKAVVLSIGGTWCANCHDEVPFLVELYKQFHAQGLEIVGLNFELDPDLARARPRVLAFIKRYGVEFPMLVPGTPDQVPSKLPQLVNFGVYPTTIFLGRDGRVRSVHVGFASAATGEEHLRLEREERELVQQLLAENPQGNTRKASAARGRAANRAS